MSSKPRLPPVQDSDATEKQRALLDSLRQPDGSVLNIFRTMATHPDLARRWLVFGNHVLAKSSLSPRVRELAILRVGWLCGSEYEWGQHVLLARDCGITGEEIARLQQDGDDSWSPPEAALLKATDELHKSQRVSDDTWRSLIEHYSVHECMDLVFAVGQYTLVSMALNTFGVERDAGVPGFDL